jgi:hypothetical protein
MSESALGDGCLRWVLEGIFEFVTADRGSGNKGDVKLDARLLIVLFQATMLIETTSSRLDR